MAKFKLKDKVFFLNTNKIAEATISSVITTETEKGKVISYNIQGDNATTPLMYNTKLEVDLFASREDLIASL